MKTNQRIKHITSVVLIGIMLFTCLSLVGLNREDAYGAAEKPATLCFLSITYPSQAV